MVAQGGRTAQPAGDGWTAALWERVRARVEAARTAGALHPLATEAEVVEEGGVPFVVRVLAGGKPRGFGGTAAADPFDPPEAALTVGEVGPCHVAVLNKFAVIPDHLLIVTRRFEHQETLLTRADLEALRRCLTADTGAEALGFYNGGEAAGASQPHKHLQLVPLPLGPAGPPVPMEAALRAQGGGAAAFDAGRAGELPFACALAPLGPADWAEEGGAERLWRLYRRLLARVGVQAVRREGRDWQTRPYNLLVTRRWMMAVPRSRERWDGISVNALGYAGSLLVRTHADIARVRAAGPMRILAQVGVPRP